MTELGKACPIEGGATLFMGSWGGITNQTEQAMESQPVNSTPPRSESVPVLLESLPWLPLVKDGDQGMLSSLHFFPW